MGTIAPGAWMLCFSGALCAATGLSAQESASIPDPATITVPEIKNARDPKIVSDGWKYFYFYRPNNSFAEAYADFAECYRFLPVPYANGALPAFAPWDEKPAARIVTPGMSPYGLVGEAIGAIVAGPLERRARQSRMRRCLEPRGYVRYPVHELTWEKIIDNYSVASIAVQAKLASGPVPDADILAVTR